MRHRILSWLSLSAVVFGSLAIAHADAYGPPFVVNTVTAGNQTPGGPLACGAQTIIYWFDASRGASFEQIYNAAGLQARSAEWQVGVAANPGVQPCAIGAARIPDGSSNGAFFTAYDAVGNVVIPQFRANDSTTGEQIPEGAAVNASGQFAVVWLDQGNNSVNVKRYQPNGALVGTAQQVALAPSNTLTATGVSIDAQGGFVVSWNSVTLKPTGGIANINAFVRRYNASAVAVGPAVLVNPSIGDRNYNGTTSIANDGSFVAVWVRQVVGSPLSASTFTIHGQRYSANGAVQGQVIQISDVSNSANTAPHVVAAPDGGFEVIWHDYDQPSGQGQILLRSYTKTGVALGPQTVISADTTTNNEFPSIAMTPDGNAIAVWRQTNPLNGTTDVVARRLRPPGVVVQEIGNGSAITGLSGAALSWQYFHVVIPQGLGTVDFITSGGTGDADLYVRYGAVPTLNQWDGRPFVNGNNEHAQMLSFPHGDWYIGIHGFADYASLRLEVASH